MKINDIIRSVLDLIDQHDEQEQTIIAEPEHEEPTIVVDIQKTSSDDEEIARMKQIAGLLTTGPADYANEPQESYADVDAVTASGTDLNKSKNPADIRSNAMSMFPAAQWRG